MRKLIVITFLTLDGVMQAPGAKEEDSENDFKYGGWQMPFFNDKDEPVPEGLGKAGGLLIGRKTYDIFAGYWPTTGKDVDWFGPFMNGVTKYVASKTLHKTNWQNSILLEGDVTEAVTKLKQEAGNDLYTFGSGDLCQTLMRHNLIDEYFLKIYPVTLGRGKRLFRSEGPKQDLELMNSKISNMGVVTLTYKVKK